MCLTSEQQAVLGLAGAGAGILSRTITHPLERVNVLLQVGAFEGAGLVAGVRRVVHRQGWLSLYRGNLANCLKVGPEKAMKFVGYETLRHALAGDPVAPTIAEDLLCSSIAAGISNGLIFPLDTLKTRLCSADRSLSFVQVLQRLQNTGGLGQFYNGLLPALLSEIPYVGIGMTVFLQGKQAYRHQTGASDNTPLPLGPLFGLSLVANVSAQLMTYPLYCIKTNMQIMDRSVNMQQCAVRMIKSQGILSLYRGIGVLTLKSMPNMLIQFTVYEHAKGILNLP